MRYSAIFFACLICFTTVSPFAVGQIYPAAKAERNETRTAVIERSDFTEGRGVALKADVEQDAFPADREPDLVFKIQTPKEGRYWITTTAGVDEIGAKKMQAAKGKFESLLAQFVIDDGSPTQRVVFVPWNDVKAKCVQRAGKFDLSGKPQILKIWLQRGVQLDTVNLVPYSPPKVPPAVAAYKPKIVPPARHPRLWCNTDTLPIIRDRLTKGENALVWEKYQTAAKKPYVFNFQPGVEAKHDANLETAASSKAFVYLMTGDVASGKEAIALMRDYLSVVSFGNWLDITREIGRAIYNGSMVYDWCYDMMSVEERDSIRKNLLRLADDMEMGWPPFIGGVVTGHGNEMQMSRDLLSMSIALYGDESVPYQYCAYRVLEELRPMLAYRYQSPRHDQGISYGPFRFECDMTAAWLLYRMNSKKVFHENIEKVPFAWIYARLPDGSVLPDGDGSYTPAYRRYANLLNYTYSENPVLKGEYLRQYKTDSDPLRWLLLNDPDLKPESDLNVLPRTFDFGSILGGIVARTGWDMSPDSKDIVVEMKGGGKHFGNHQHSDAGSFQIYFHEYLVGDLGIYGFYGTPYDMNFNKRSVAHSMMLVYDPEEMFAPATSRSRIGNDGGGRLHLQAPSLPSQAQKEPYFNNGETLASAWGPDSVKPDFSFYSVDLADVYSDKIKEYVRTFCFLQNVDENVPGVLLIHDRLSVPNSSHREYWQINSLKKPVLTAEGIRIPAGKKEQKGFIDLNMLIPGPKDRTIEIFSDPKTVHEVFGAQYTPPSTNVQTRGSRTLFSPKQQGNRSEFLTAIQMVDGTEKNPVPVVVTESERMQFLALGRYQVGLNRTNEPLKEELTLELPKDRDSRVLLTGLQPGKWSVRCGGQTRSLTVLAKNSTLYFEGKGKCIVRPEK